MFLSKANRIALSKEDSINISIFNEQEIKFQANLVQKSKIKITNKFLDLDNPNYQDKPYSMSSYQTKKREQSYFQNEEEIIFSGSPKKSKNSQKTKNIQSQFIKKMDIEPDIEYSLGRHKDQEIEPKKEQGKVQDKIKEYDKEKQKEKDKELHKKKNIPEEKESEDEDEDEDEDDEDEEIIEDVIQIQQELPYPKPMRIIQYNDLKDFLGKPLTQSGMMQCTLVRKRSAFNRWTPTFELFISHNDCFLMIAKKELCTGSINYQISMNQEVLDAESPFYMGKMRGSLQDFVFYDDGGDPKKMDLFRENRKYIGNLSFDLLDKHKRIVAIPQSTYKYNTKQPEWDEQYQKYNHDYHGRGGKIPSIKNCQYVRELDERQNIHLQFTKDRQDVFLLDFQRPFSPIQAFMIALTNFELIN